MRNEAIFFHFIGRNEAEIVYLDIIAIYPERGTSGRDQAQALPTYAPSL